MSPSQSKSKQPSRKQPSRPLVATVGLTLPDGRRIERGELLPDDYEPATWLITQGKVKSA